MIDQALVFLKDQLNASLKDEFAGDGSEAEKDLVVFIDGDKMEPLTFASGAVSVLLVNIERERIMRRAEPHRAFRPNPAYQPDNGEPATLPLKVNPELRLDLCVLFVARFKQYEMALKVLSGIVRFFQRNPIFVGSDTTPLPGGIERLSVEEASLPLAAQNDVWSTLRTTYLPSVLYRVRTLVMPDGAPTDAAQITRTEHQLDTRDAHEREEQSAERD